MAASELDQVEEGNWVQVATENTSGSLRVRVTCESTFPPEQVLAAAYDFSERREQMWPKVEAKRLEVHELGDTHADVTEGTLVVGVFWERCRYDWSTPGTVTATVLESNVLDGGSPPGCEPS